MKVLFFGDIVGKPGRHMVAKILPTWQKKFRPDFVIANGENLAHGDGVTRETLDEILALGVDVVTSGNHIFHRSEVVELLEDHSKPLLRPENILKDRVPGRGWLVAERGGKKIVVLNLIGITQFKPHSYANPFYVASRVMETISASAPDLPILLDFHAEATSEKKAMGWFLDGKVAAVIGTHTHVPTRDERILPKGTAYITDTGMVGPRDSVLGIEIESIVTNFTIEPRIPIDIAEGPVEANAVLIEINPKSKLAIAIKYLSAVV